MTISVDKAVEQLDSQSQVLRESRQRLTEQWHPDAPPLSLVMSGYARALSTNINELSEEEKRSVFSVVEMLLSDADDVVRDAVATCFLEGLLGQASSGSLDFRKVAHLLGSRSRSYCQEWDNFSGVRTPGLS